MGMLFMTGAGHRKADADTGAHAWIAHPKQMNEACAVQDVQLGAPETEEAGRNGRAERRCAPLPGLGSLLCARAGSGMRDFVVAQKAATLFCSFSVVWYFCGLSLSAPLSLDLIFSMLPAMYQNKVIDCTSMSLRKSPRLPGILRAGLQLPFEERRRNRTSAEISAYLWIAGRQFQKAEKRLAHLAGQAGANEASNDAPQRAIPSLQTACRHGWLTKRSRSQSINSLNVVQARRDVAAIHRR